MTADDEQKTAHAERGRYDSIFGSAGASSAAPLAPRAERRDDRSATKRVARGVLGWAKTAAITLGVMYLLGWVATVGFVTQVNQRFWRPNTWTNSVERMAPAAVTLKYRLPTDPSITPDAAGVALAALSTANTQKPIGFTYREIPDRPSAPWRTLPIPQEIFPGVSFVNGVPDPEKILAIARGPLNTTQRQALKMIGTAGIWRSFDLVARASAVDVLGGRLNVPFGDNALFFYLPFGGNPGTRWLAQAGVSRAAWHLSEGRRDSAEFVLRGIVSFGAAIVENAPLLIEQLAGNSVITTGRGALVRYYTLVGDARGATLAAEADAAIAGYKRPAVLDPLPRGDLAETQRRLLAIINSRDLPRALRIETLTQLKASSCQSFRQVAFGEDDLVRTTAAALKAELARFPSEQALIDLIATPLTDQSVYAFLEREGSSAEALAAVAKLYFNPRIANCGIGGGAFR